MDSAVRALVWQRAGDRCEYCHLHQSDSPFRTFHIDHIVPRKHQGTRVVLGLRWKKELEILVPFRRTIPVEFLVTGIFFENSRTNWQRLVLRWPRATGACNGGETAGTF
jgi:hypothetical protein